MSDKHPILEPKPETNETGWGMFDEERVYDQPCRFEMRIGGHSTYCAHPDLPRGRCEYRYTSAQVHSECKGFEDNPVYKAEIE